MKILPLFAVCLLPLRAFCASPELDIPEFQHLRALAVDSTDVRLDGALLKLVSQFAQSAEDEDMRQLIAGIRSVEIRNFEFDRDELYSVADVDKVRKQLASPAWSSLAQIHKRQPREDVDVFLRMDDGKPTGLAVVASKPRSFTIVHITGVIDMKSLAKLEGHLGIPKISATE